MKRAEVKKFVEFYGKNAAQLAEAAMYFPLPAELAKRSRKNARALTPGTHFVTPDGKQREGAFVDLFKAENLVNVK
jgi:hypothetical protein